MTELQVLQDISSTLENIEFFVVVIAVVAVFTWVRWILK